MSYISPYIDQTGIHLPTYQDILDDLISLVKGIYGSDIYLDVDSSDYQFLSIFALKMYDNLMAVQLAYNNRGPSTAIGSGLDGVVKINGIKRQQSTNSTCVVTLTGVVGTTIINGVVQDTAGNNWLLSASVVIPGGGELDVTVTAEDAGAVEATINTINKIITLQAGWLTVNNPTYAATAGDAAELDSELRARQTLSTNIAAITPMGALIAAVSAITGVSRVKGYENDTDTTGEFDLPAHSICVVVEGGDINDVAEAIALKKTIGTGTFGSETVEVQDYVGNYIDIKFSPVSQVYISVEITINTLSGWMDSIEDMIKDSVTAYINSIPIGDDVFRTKIIAAASLWGLPEAVTFTITQVLLGRPGDSPAVSDDDVVIDFDESAVCHTGESPDYIDIVKI
jgi:hypothetical protein